MQSGASIEDPAILARRNDDSSRAIRLYARGVADAVIEGRSQSVEEIVEASRDEFVEVNDEAGED